MQTMNVAINGFGRIGRNFLRAFFESKSAKDDKYLGLNLVAINDIGSLESIAHLLKYDSTHGVFGRDVSVAIQGDQKGLLIDQQFIPVFHSESPEMCPWDENNVDIVIESTGCFRSRAQAQLHLNAGAKKVLIAAVAFDEVDASIVYGVNEDELKPEDKIISATSCTTHCVAPILNLLATHYSIESVLMTEIHAYTSDQQILDHVHRDLRRARAGALNIIPTTSSSVSAVQKILPDFEGKLIGYSMRVPVNNVAAVDLTINFSRAVSAKELNEFVKGAADEEIVAYSELPLVSSDFNHRKESAIFDASQTQALNCTVKILVWYDNEWAYVNRLLDLLVHNMN